jgi:hypothetical protein
LIRLNNIFAANLYFNCLYQHNLKPFYEKSNFFYSCFFISFYFRHQPKPLAADGLFYDKVEEKKPTGIATVLAGLVVYFISTATDEAERREKKTIKFKADFDN